MRSSVDILVQGSQRAQQITGIAFRTRTWSEV